MSIKSISRIIVFLLIALTFPAICLAESMTLHPEDNIVCFVEHQGETYVLNGSHGHLYRLDAGGQSMTRIQLINLTPNFEQNPTILHLISSQESLYALNDYTGGLYEIVLSGDTATMSGITVLNMHAHEEGIAECEELSSIFYARNCACLEGKLYLTAVCVEYGKEALCAYDLDTFEKRIVPINVPFYEMVSAHGQLLGLQRNEKDWFVSCLDPETEKLTYLCTGPATEFMYPTPVHLCYNADANLITIQLDTSVYAVGKDGEMTEMAKAPWGKTCAALLSDKVYALGDFGVTVYPLDKTSTLDSVTIMSAYWHSNFAPQFLSRHLTFDVHDVEITENDAEAPFTEAMLLQSGNVDIYELPIGSTLRKATAQGYYLPIDLPEDAVSVDFLPIIKDAVMCDGQLIAYPIRLYQESMAYDRTAAELLGISSEEIPSTFEELYQFIITFEEKYGEKAERESISLFAEPTSGEALSTSLAFMIDQQYKVMLDGEAALTAEEEVEVAWLLERFLSLDLAPLSCNIINRDRNGRLIPAEQKGLFTVEASVLPEYQDKMFLVDMSNYTPILPKLLEDREPMLVMSGTVLLINPYTTSADATQRLMCCTMQDMDADVLTSTLAEPQPVESESYLFLLNKYQSDIEDLELRKLTASEADTRDLDADIAAYHQKILNLEDERWVIPQSYIDDYQSLLSGITVVWEDDITLVDNENATSLIYQLLDGIITPQSYVLKLKDIHRMIAWEQ